MASCLCASRGYVRALEEDDFGFPDKIASLVETPEALLGRCRECGAWWERLPHYVYGYAWYRTEQRYWDLADEAAARRAWLARRREQGL
ncbi:MAG: hypothetical protein ACHQ7N_16175 [Candidatus Methylomirabilales bacterium]